VPATGPSRTRRRIIWSLAIVFVLLALNIGVFGVALSGCLSCHNRGDFRAATAESPHAGVDCRSCHAPQGTLDWLAFSWRQPLHMVKRVRPGATRDSATVPDSRCASCHEEIYAATLTSNGVRIAHESCAANSSCTDCHSATAHGAATSWIRSYAMDQCLECHISGAGTDCDMCHDGRLPSDRIASGSFAVTHGAQWRTTHGMGNGATCTVCHSKDDCLECHGPGLPHEPEFVSTHADYAAEAGAQCAGCHEQAFCDACHGTPMPHEPEFVQDHPNATQPALCERCHAESDCTICHETHVHPGGAVDSAPAGGGEG